MIRTNPSKGVKLPRKQDSDISFLQGDELAEFMTQLKGNIYAPLFEFMLATGCRPGEARAVMWSDIDWKKKTVYIQRSVTDQTPYVFTEPKTSKGKRTVSLPDKTVDRLKAHKADQGKERLEAGPDWSNLDLIFCDSKGEPLDRRNLANKHLKKILKATAEKLHPSKKGEAYKRILGCSLYSLRHTSATTLIERGVNLRTVSERLGHKDVETTLSVYVHHTQAMEEHATEEISKALYS
jgi:integrase